MRRLVKFKFLLVLVTILFGCGSSRKAVYSDKNVIREDSTWKNLSYLHGTKVRLTDLVSTDMGIKIRYTRYDTGKPNDDVTGLPPVEEEGEVELDFNQDRKTDADVADSTQTKVSEESVYKTEETSHYQEAAERDETDLFKDIKGVAICTAILLFVLMIYRQKKTD